MGSLRKQERNPTNELKIFLPKKLFNQQNLLEAPEMYNCMQKTIVNFDPGSGHLYFDDFLIVHNQNVREGDMVYLTLTKIQQRDIKVIYHL